VKRSHFSKCVCSALILLVWGALSLSGQTGNGVVQGTILDPTKAAVPAAKVDLKNSATGVVRSTQSNGVGVYYFGSVPPGPYVLTVEASGFKKWEGTLTLVVGQTAAVDPTLEVGTLQATVEVTGAAPVVTTQGMQVSDVKDALQIHQLPLNGRAVTNLFNLTPGVEGGGNPRTNGMKVGSTEMLLDGISLVDRFGGGMARVQPGLDTIQEYRVETAGSGAQYSRPATVALVTKSGTNQFHGSAFETFRNNFGGLRARQRQDLPVPGESFTQAQYIRNEYGISAGGPVIKNKTFWFFSYEASRLRQGDFARVAAPTTAMWNGDFSNAITTNSEPITIYDPSSTTANGTRLPFHNNQIPTNLIAPIARTMQGISPVPNLPGNPWIEPNFQTYYPDQNDIDTFTIKGDHVFSEHDNLSGRFTKSEQSTRVYGGVFGYPAPGCTNCGGSTLSHPLLYSSMARWNHVFSPTLLNEFQASNNRSAKDSGTLGNNVNWADKLGLPNPFGVTGWPTISLSDPFLYYGWDGDNRKDEMLTQFQIDDNVTWIKGKHSFKFGFKGRQEYNNIRELQQSQGSHSFYNDWTGLYDPVNQSQAPLTGSGLATLELGLPSYLSNQYNRGYFYFRQKEIGLYAQDSWKVSRRLTLDLGLRWDKWTPYTEKYNRLVNVDLNTYANTFQVITPGNTQIEDIQGIPPAVLASWKQRGLTWVTANSIGFPSSLLPADNNNFGPRVGVAFRVTDKWILRSGYGRYFWTMPLSQILQTSRTNPPLNLRFQNDFSNRNGQQDFYSLANVPAPNDFVGKATVDTTTIQGISSRSQAMMAWDVRDWKDDQADEWTFTLERELMKETALRLSYIGNHGSNLEQRFDINNPTSEYNYQAATGLAANSGNADPRRVNPNWNFAAANHTGYSNTTSFQAEVERRYSKGLAFQWFYVYTHTLSTTDAGGFTSGNGAINAAGTGVFSVPASNEILGNPNLTYDQRLRLGYFNSGNVPSHRVRWNGLYDLPFGKGHRWGGNASGAMNQIIGGWQIAFIGNWGSGNWLGVSSGLYMFGDPTLSADQRPVVDIFGREQRLWFRGYFDPTLATGPGAAQLLQLVPADPTQRVLRPLRTSDGTNRVYQVLANGSVRLTTIGDNVNWNSRNFFRGPGAWNEDLSLFKNFRITERIKTRLTGDFFNAFNHPNDVNPSTTTGLQDLSVQANDPRIIQFTLRVEW
jgi:carboxypeptidase family protein/TonB-dependent receptor-like protein